MFIAVTSVTWSWIKVAFVIVIAHYLLSGIHLCHAGTGIALSVGSLGTLAVNLFHLLLVLVILIQAISVLNV